MTTFEAFPASPVLPVVMSGARVVASARVTYGVPLVLREDVDAALARDRMRRRAERGDLMAVAAVTGIDPADLYAEALMLGALEGTT